MKEIDGLMARSHYRVIEWLCIYDQTVNGQRARQADDDRGCWVGTAWAWERTPGGQGPHVKECADVLGPSAAPDTYSDTGRSRPGACTRPQNTVPHTDAGTGTPASCACAHTSITHADGQCTPRVKPHAPADAEGWHLWRGLRETPVPDWAGGMLCLGSGVRGWKFLCCGGHSSCRGQLVTCPVSC